MEELRTYNLLINGQPVTAEGDKIFDSINPSTGKIFSRLADASLSDMKRAIQAAREAYDVGPWGLLSADDRGKYLTKIARLIREHAKELAELESLDTGKTLKQTTFIDVPTCAETFDYFSTAGKLLTGQANLVSAPVESRTEREPMGVVGCIIPWNYPLIMFGWKVAPALLAGNTVVFKPSSQASVAISRLGELIKETGLPDGVLNIVTSASHEVANELAANSSVDLLSFTGGSVTGQAIMRQAAETTKKLSLELGGKSPNIVFADCDLETAIGGTMSAIFMNQGQMCTAGSRLLLQDKIYDEFLAKLKAKTAALKIGSSLSYENDFGPLVSRKHRDQVLAYINKGREEGATLLCGGGIPENLTAEEQHGFYLEPTIFSEVKKGMTILEEEIFGPVLCVQKFSGTDEAIRLANDTIYGLAACVWTKDLSKAKSVARKLKCGTVWINTYGGFYNEASFGGFKQSGFGRELGAEGLFEYTQSKHVCIDQTPGGRPLVAGWF